MKIRKDDLSNLYLSLAKSKIGNEKNCPEADKLIKAFTDEVSAEDKSRIVDHISSCSQCLEKFQTVIEFFKQGRRLAKEMEGVSVSGQELSLLKDIQTKKISGTKRKTPIIKFLAVAAMLFFIVVTVMIIQSGKDSNDKILRGTAEGEFSLLAPQGEVDKTYVIFKWQSMTGISGYQVDLCDEELTHIWKSPVTKETSLKLPSDIFRNLNKRKIYYWKLVLFQAETIIRESEFQKFIIK